MAGSLSRAITDLPFSRYACPEKKVFDRNCPEEKELFFFSGGGLNNRERHKRPEETG